jgi:hypothetical protein
VTCGANGLRFGRLSPWMGNCSCGRWMKRAPNAVAGRRGRASLMITTVLRVDCIPKKLRTNFRIQFNSKQSGPAH